MPANTADGRDGWNRSIAAGSVYFAIVFAVGFALGALRTMFVAPAVGEVWAVAIELPVILALSWLVCRRVSARFEVPAAIGPRFVMGLSAFALLMIAELGLSVFGFGRSVAEHLALYGALPGLLGLVAQAAFALFPLLQGAAITTANNPNDSG